MPWQPGSRVPLGLNFQGCQEMAVMLGKEYCMNQRLAIKKKKECESRQDLPGVEMCKKKKKRKSKNGLKKRSKNPSLGLKTRLW